MNQQQSLAALAALLLGQSSLVAAQSTNDDVMLEEVTVTAQRRAERLQDVPVAVTAFTAAEIEARGVGSTRDILPMTPNVTYDESFTVGNSFISVRGVAQINN